MATFNYSFTFPDTDPDCVSRFQRTFAHRDWVDGQDIIQAEMTSAEDGFNKRFHSIEKDLDDLNLDSKEAFRCIAELRHELFLLLADIKNQFNSLPVKTTKESKDGKDGKESKEGKETKEGKDGKESKEGKDSKEGKESKDTKETKESKDHKDGKEDKDGKELGAMEKQLDRADGPWQLPGMPQQPGLLSFLFAEESVRPPTLPLGRAFIRPDERPAVGQRALAASASRPPASSPGADSTGSRS